MRRPVCLYISISHELWLFWQWSGSHTESASNPRHLLRKWVRGSRGLFFFFSFMHGESSCMNGVSYMMGMKEWERLMEWRDEWLLAVNCYSENNQFLPMTQLGITQETPITQTNTKLYGISDPTSTPTLSPPSFLSTHAGKLCGFPFTSFVQLIHSSRIYSSLTC